MAKIDLLNLEETGVVGGLSSLKILQFGSNNTGKSFQATKFPSPLLLSIEAGGSALKCKKVPISKWSDFLSVVKQLTNEKTIDEMTSLYKTIIIDTAEALVGLSEQATCGEFGVTDLSQITGRVNGYKISRTNFQNAINLLTNAGYCCLFLAHEEKIEEIDEVTGEAFSFIIPKQSGNEKSSMRMLRDLCDITCYIKANPIDMETYEEVPSSVIFKRTKHVFSRSRFGDICFKLDQYTAEGFIKVVEEAIKKRAESENSEIVNFKRAEIYTKEEWLEMIKPLVMKLHPIYPEKINEIVEEQLGVNRKISSATEEEIKMLETIYTKMMDYMILRGID